MTRSNKLGTAPDASAQELLESFSSLLLQEARQVAARRSSEDNRVSSLDILDSLENRQERVRWRERVTFAAQVTLTAVAISATVISFAVIFLAVSSGATERNDVASSSKSFFIVVLLVTLLIVATAILFVIFRESQEGRVKKSWSHSRKTRLVRSSRRESELALLSGWSDFEEFMKRELYADPSDAPVHDLARDIVRFSQRYDLNPEEIRSILRARNAIAHDPHTISLIEVRKNILRLQSLLEKLSPLQSTNQQKPLRETG